MKWRPYPTYKPSGVDWLGDVPEHWEVKRAAASYQIQLGKMLQPNSIGSYDKEVPYFKAQHVQWEAVETSNLPLMWASPADQKKYSIVDGDLLVCEGGEVGRAGIVKNPPIGSIHQNALHRVRSLSENNIRLLMYVLEHAASQDWFTILCNRATIAHFTGDKFSELRIPLPPTDEQTAIADFLDHETGKIDTLVAKKQTLIERLKEKRTALISRTVTHGLPPDEARKAGFDPHPKLKPSSIDWLGDVPEHWEIKRVKHNFICFGGGTPSKTIPEYWNGSIPWVSPKDMSCRTISDTEDHISEAALMESATRMVPPDATLIVVRSGILKHKIPVAMNSTPVALNQDMKALVTRGFIANAYLTYFIEGHNKSLLDIWSKNGCTVESIEMDSMLNSILPVPPHPEQTAIADFLDRETGKIDKLITKIETAIERLREYRTALITAAVTGKIDVRESTA